MADRPCCPGCPLAQLPPGFLQRLLWPPFYRRHPIVCLLGLILLLGLAGGIIGSGLIGGGERIALVSVRGVINDVDQQLEWIRQISEKPGVKGVLVRVDSPGGGAAASHELYLALKNLASTRPLVVSMGATAASGGLMVSMAGERVFANPSTITGSIGVRMDIPQLQGLMEKIGVGQETIVTGPYKDAASWTRPLSPRDREYFQHVLDNLQGQFVEIVASQRHMSREQASALADGRIFTGQEALALGLVDEMGGEKEALDWLCARAGVAPSRQLLRQKSRESLIKRLQRLSGATALADMARDLARPAFLFQSF